MFPCRIEGRIAGVLKTFHFRNVYYGCDNAGYNSIAGFFLL